VVDQEETKEELSKKARKTKNELIQILKIPLYKNNSFYKKIFKIYNFLFLMQFKISNPV